MTTITGIFESAFFARKAVEELEATGIARDRIGLIVTEATRNNAVTLDVGSKAAKGGAMGATIGGTLGALTAGLTAFGSVVVPGLGFLAVGPIAAALVGAGAGGAVGGVVGSLIGLGIPEYEAKIYESKLREGSILVAVDTISDEETACARRVLSQHNAIKVAA